MNLYRKSYEDLMCYRSNIEYTDFLYIVSSVISYINIQEIHSLNFAEKCKIVNYNLLELYNLQLKKEYNESLFNNYDSLIIDSNIINVELVSGYIFKYIDYITKNYNSLISELEDLYSKMKLFLASKNAKFSLRENISIIYR
jgi:hypothetical protein